MTTDFHEWLAHPETLNGETLQQLRALVDQYPYFQTVRLLYLKNLYLLNDPSFGDELRKAAIHITDRRVLFRLIEGERFALHPQRYSANRTSKETDADRTLHLINEFLSFAPEEREQPAADKTLSNDYATYVLREDDLPEAASTLPATPMRGQSLIDEFIEKADDGFPLRIVAKEEEEDVPLPTEENIENQEEEDDDEGYFTETLAKIYIKQQKYSKALEIIKKLSLKYPKKNAYFADQIRFLEKLIINTKSK